MPWGAGGVAGGLLAGCCGLLTLRLPAGTTGPFLALGLGVATISVVAAVVYARPRLRALRALAGGSSPPSKEGLMEAAREVAGFPGLALRASLVLWALAPVSLALAFKLWCAEVGWGLVLRVAALGVLVGPVSSTLGYYLLLLGGRRLLDELSTAGLPAVDLVRAMPAARGGLRTRLLALGVVVSLSPALLTAYASLSLGMERWEQLARLSAPARHALAEELSAGGLPGAALLCVLATALALATACAAGLARGRPLRALADGAAGMSVGQLAGVPVVPADDDEVRDVSSALASLITSLTGALTQLRDAGGRLSGASEQIAAISRSQEEGAVRQAGALDETLATTEMLASTAGQNARGASSVDGLASRTLSAARVGERAAQSFASSMLKVREDNQAVASAVQELHLQVGRIGRIVEFIRDVADRADLLAVNAELEGSRAGDVGLGFSLIAAEMRRLAESVLRTTQEIEQLIQEIRDGTLAAVQATQDCVQVTETGMQLAGEISGSFRKVLELAHRTADAIKAISLSTHLQQTGTGQLAATMGEVLQAMQESSEANRRMGTASDDLAALARKLGEVVSRFEVGPPEEHA